MDFKTTWSLQKMVEEKLFFEGTSENKYSGDGWSLQLRGLGYVAANHNIRSLDPSSATTSSKGKDYFWNYNPLSHNFKKIIFEDSKQANSLNLDSKSGIIILGFLNLVPQIL